MPYYYKDSDGKDKEVPVTIQRSDDYKTYYSHGAQGGIIGSYHFRIDFYRDDIPPSMDVEELGGKLSQKIPKIIREIDASIYISLPFAKQLRDWLAGSINEYEDKYGEIMIASDEKPEGVE